MKFQDKLNLAFKNLYRKKKNFLNFFLLTLSIIMILLTFCFKETLDKNFKEQYEKNLSYKTLIVFGENINKNILEKNPLIKKVISENEYSAYVTIKNFQNSKKNVPLLMYGIDYDMIKTENRFFSKDLNLKDNFMICPTKFFPEGELINYDQNYNEKLIDGKEMLNKTYTISFSNLYTSKKYEDQYKVVDIYDTNLNFSEDYSCYTSFENIKKINNKIEEKEKVVEFEKKFFIIAKSSKDIKKIKLEIEKNNYIVEPLIKLDYSIIEKIEIIAFILSISVLFISILSIVSTFAKTVYDNEKNIILFKSLGFNKKIISQINNYEAIMLGIISFVFSIIISKIIYNIIIKTYKQELIIDKIQIQISFLSIIITLIIAVIIPILGIKIANLKKIKKESKNV